MECETGTVIQHLLIDLNRFDERLNRLNDFRNRLYVHENLNS